ncbi:spore germination protein [Neobacillus cucumis]|uniref:Uncharacterized protein n=1 Tax=Neobacillus cucumis TaxID=1740721 RepID=A0A2N5HGY8_9BACI|nr:spore germination protein [Neobacillus cucumis]PLS04782.1 hypothetical protein CVD27_11030 [Neobacillus cucumis]
MRKKQVVSRVLTNYLQKFKNLMIFGQFSLTNNKGHFILSYYNTPIDRIQLQRRVLHIFQEPSFDFSYIKKIDDIKQTIPIEDIVITDNIEAIQTKLLNGYAILQIKENDYKVALINLSNEKDDIYSKIAFYFLYCYIPFLFVFIYMKQKIMKQQNNVVSHN